MHTYEKVSDRKGYWASGCQIGIFNKFGLSMGIRVGETLSRQWTLARSFWMGGPPGWMSAMSSCLSWSHKVHTGWKETPQKRKERGKTLISFYQTMETKRQISSRESDTWQSTLVSFLSTTVSSSAITVGEHQLEIMGWEEPTLKLKYAVNI